MNLSRLQAVSQMADDMIAEANSRINLKPRGRKCTVNTGKQKLKKIKSFRPSCEIPCGFCKTPTMNKIYCSRECTLNGNRHKREYKAKKESSKIKRQQTIQAKMEARATVKCGYRECEKFLNPNTAIAHQRKYHSISCAAKERYAKKRDSLLNTLL